LNKPDKINLLKDKITSLVRHAAEDRIRKHTGQSEFTVVDVEDHIPGQVLGNWMSLILITGSSLKITLKLHFSHKDIKPLVYPVYRKASAADISDQQSMDFVKELCNLIAGFIEQTFEHHDISLGISLPLGTRGFYELFSEYSPSDYPIIKYHDIWRLSLDDLSIFGTVQFEISDPNALENISSYDHNTQDEDEDEGEFDFL
jgi:hypothetical protein